jgi:hypothetical protein
MTSKHLLIIWLALLPALLSGCASFGRGVTEAIMDRQSEDTRQCWIEGREFDGLDRLFAQGDGDSVRRHG